MTTTWADVSEYQADPATKKPVPIDVSYPHPVFAFRTNSGDHTDRIGLENARRARMMLDTGQLAAVIPYYVFLPGQGNCDLHREILTSAGLWGHRCTATMVDVESAGGRVRGDQSAEIADEIDRLRRWYGDSRRVIGYFNAVADPGLWRTRPAGLRFVTPSYSHAPGVWAATAPPEWMQTASIAQQYTDRGRCAPWPGLVDLNQSPLAVPDLLAVLGIDHTEQGGPVSDPVTTGAAQLRPWPDKIRQIRHPEFVNESTRSPAEPWTYDMWADMWNETVWDGFELPDTYDDAPKSLAGWVLDNAATNRAILDQLVQLRAAVACLLGQGK